MTITTFSDHSSTVCQRRAKTALQGVAVVTLGVLAGAAIGCAIVTPIMVADNHDKVSALTSALAAGDKIVNFEAKAPYVIQCTGPGQANAFKIKIDPATADKVVTKDALVGFPQWPLNRWFPHSVRAGRCDGGVN